MRWSAKRSWACLALLGVLGVPAQAFALDRGGAQDGPRGTAVRTAILVAGLVVTSLLFGRFAPAKRKRLKPIVVLLTLSFLGVGLGWVFSFAGWQDRANQAWWFGGTMETLAAVHLTAVVVFDLLLRVVRITPAVIVSDVVVGMAYVGAFLTSLHEAGVNLSGIVATSAVVSGVLGLSLAPTLGNILGGVALQVDDSIHEGDWIQLDANTQGRVKSIRWRHTVVETRNWDTIIVPNATLLSANIMILGKRSGKPTQRRYWVYFNVDFRFPPWAVVAAVNEALQSSPIPNVASDPKAHAICMDWARDGRDSMGYYAVRFWLTDLAVDDPTASMVRERIYAGLRRAGIPQAVPASTVFLSLDDAAHHERKAAREHGRRVELLASLELFREFTEDELSLLAQRLKSALFARGEVITQQGREAHWLYILAQGEADVMVQVGAAAPERVATIAAPTFFGEMSVMTGEPRSATVIAATPSECYRLDKEAFREIMMERHEIAAIVSSVLARRRSQLDAVRENLDAEQMGRRMVAERARLLSQIERFFGLGDERESRS